MTDTMRDPRTTEIDVFIASLSDTHPAAVWEFYRHRYTATVLFRPLWGVLFFDERD